MVHAECAVARLARFPAFVACGLVIFGLFAPVGARAQRFVEPGTHVVETAPPAVGACIGGSCGPRVSEPRRERRPPNRRTRFAFTGAVLGAVSAGLLLGSAIAIAVVDDAQSERVTRGVWLGEVAVATPLVALSGWTARRQAGFAGYRGLRQLGWIAYGAAIADGIVLWYATLEGTRMPPALTVGAGVIAVFALLPHALDSYVSGRRARHGGRVALGPGLVGLRF
jgi:hypothetical protein